MYDTFQTWSHDHMPLRDTSKHEHIEAHILLVWTRTWAISTVYCFILGRTSWLSLTMTTTFTALPIVDLSGIRLDGQAISTDTTTRLSQQLYDVFATTGFAYLISPPLSFNHDEVFEIAREFFSLSEEEKMQLAKKTFRSNNNNTYRGYFPTQPLGADDNLKEGFEIGPADSSLKSLAACTEGVNLGEQNVWPSDSSFAHRARLEMLYTELQMLATKLLSLLAISLERPADYFDHYLCGSISTLRLLHYPGSRNYSSSSTSLDSTSTFNSTDSSKVNLCCTPHTDSGIMTLLHQDSTGGLEVQDVAGAWVPAPYVPGSIVVNIGDLMAEVSGGRFVATMHRVRTPTLLNSSEDGLGRFSVPFFFEPGEHCIVKSVDDAEGEGIVYGEHVRQKMKGWVEFMDREDSD